MSIDSHSYPCMYTAHYCFSCSHAQLTLRSLLLWAYCENTAGTVCWGCLSAGDTQMPTMWHSHHTVSKVSVGGLIPKRIFPCYWKSTYQATPLHRGMMTSWNGNIFCVTGPLWGESTGYQWIPLTMASDMKLWCFLRIAPEQTVEQTIETLVILDAFAFGMKSL